MDRPNIVTDEHLIFLDDLRQSGLTNNFGSRDYVEREFDVDKKQAKEIVIYWMQSFNERHPEIAHHR